MLTSFKMSYGHSDVRMVPFTITPEAQTTIIKDSREQVTNDQNKNTNIGITNNVFINMNRAIEIYKSY